MRKAINVVLMALLLVVSMVPLNVEAANFVTINEVEVNGVELDASTSTLFVERNSKANVRVQLIADADVKDVKVRAWIGGYEHGNILDSVGPFDLKKGTTKAVSLVLNMPNDIEAGKDYTLRVEAFNDAESVPFSASVKLNVEETRHSIELFDVLFTPGLHVDAGEPLFVNARVKNRGDKIEKDIRVSVKVPELGIEQAVYIDELVSEVQDKDDKDRTSSASTNDIVIEIPENTERKDYQLIVEAEFNGRRDVSKKEYTLTVNGESSKDLVDSRVLVNVDNVKSARAGDKLTFVLDLANLNDDNMLLLSEVVGVKGWATAVTEPSVVSLDSGEVSQMLLTLNVNEGASGDNSFVLRLSESGRTVKEVPLKVSLGGKSAVTGSATGNVRTGLEWVFIVLLVILVVLGIVIALKRKGNDEEPLAPSAESGETKSYY